MITEGKGETQAEVRGVAVTIVKKRYYLLVFRVFIFLGLLE